VSDGPSDDCEDCAGLRRRVDALELRAQRADMVSALIGALLALVQHLL
jgi:hypothetical protein